MGFEEMRFLNSDFLKEPLNFLNYIDSIEKYGFWGLVLFVGVPLPGTGAWTGCLIATMLRMDKKKAFLATLLGVVMASIIMMLVSYGVLANIF